MPTLSIEELTERFPFFRSAFVFADPLSIALHRSNALAKEIAAAEAECRRRWIGVKLSAIPDVAACRAAYEDFGIKRTSYRSSVERLIKRVIAGQPVPSINALVDLHNMVSLETGLCLGCDDLDRTSGGLVFRFSRAFGSSRHGGGSRRSERSTEGRRGRLRRRPPRSLPPLELAPGLAAPPQASNQPRGAHRPVERRRRRPGRSG